MNIGQMIKKLRKEQGFTQKKLGELSGINEVQIRQYELGKANPKLETLKKISDALDVPLWGFLEENLDTYSIDEIKKEWAKGPDETLHNELLVNFNKLNLKGKTESVKRVSELTHIPDYTD